MPRSPSAHGRTGRPRLTSRTQILAGARRLIDRDGWEKLTIRRLAAEIGVGAATIYHHVRDKEDLLVLLLNEYTEQIERPRLPDDPRDRIVTAAITMHDALAAWPWAAEILTVDGFIGRLGESALWMVETILEGAIDYGCTPAQAVDVFRNLWYYTVGEILVRAHSGRRPVGDQGPFLGDSGPANFSPSRLPRLGAVSGQWATLAARDIYPEGLRAFVTGLLTQYSSPAVS